MKITDFGVAIIEDDSHLSKWIQEHKTLEIAKDWCHLFRKYIPIGGTVVDIGACLGDTTATFSKMVGERGHVTAFEPNPPAFFCLRHNMKPYKNVTIYPVGLSDVRSHVHMVQWIKEDKNLGAYQVREGGDIVVMPLDEMIFNRLDFIKIDAEGYEPKILVGAAETIEKFQPTIVLELNRKILGNHGLTDQDVFKAIENLDYTFKPAEPHHSIDMEQVDLLCLPKFK